LSNQIVYWPLLQKRFGGGGDVVRGVVYIIRTPRAGSTGFRQETGAENYREIEQRSDGCGATPTTPSSRYGPMQRSTAAGLLNAGSGGVAESNP
jgi:hypothetical protein